MDDDESESADSAATSPTASRSERGSGSSAFAPRRVPSPTNRHFRPGGIMYGVKRTGGIRKGWMLDERCEKKSAKAYGHNGLQVGQWFQSQLLALRNGVHGQKQAGIAGSVDTGAWSVIVSGKYSKLDLDEGDVIWYSGSNSEANTDPTKPMPSSNGTLALKASQRTHNPVRVLRGEGKAVWGPKVGLRYDGLYQVTAMETPKNDRGGLYERFKLVREGDQPSLESLRNRKLDTARPTEMEIRDYNDIKDNY